MNDALLIPGRKRIVSMESACVMIASSLLLYILDFCGWAWIQYLK